MDFLKLLMMSQKSLLDNYLAKAIMITLGEFCKTVKARIKKEITLNGNNKKQWYLHF